VRQSSGSKDVNTESEGSTALEAVTRQRLKRISTCSGELQSV
jgi:hypothetical protein